MSVPFALNTTTAPATLVAGVEMFGCVKLGALLVTVTLNEPLAVRPPRSVTVQFTVVVPIGKVDPDAGAQIAAIVTSSRSVPLAVNVTAAPAALVAGVVMSAGGVKLGPLFDTVTVTVNEPLAVSPPLSVTVQFTVVVPIAKRRTRCR